MTCITSYFFYLGSCYSYHILLDLFLSHLDVVPLTFVVLWQAMGIAIRAITALASRPQQSYLLPAGEATRMVGLFVLLLFSNVRDLVGRCLCDDFISHLVVPVLMEGYLKQTEHMFRLAGFPKNFLHLVQSCSDIALYQSLCYNIRLTVFEI